MPGASMVASSALGGASAVLATAPVGYAFLRLLRAAKKLWLLPTARLLRLLRAAVLGSIAFHVAQLPLGRRQRRAWLGMICSSACGMAVSSSASRRYTIDVEFRSIPASLNITLHGIIASCMQKVKY